MRNRITLLMAVLFVMCASQSFAQYDVLDFETGATGTTFNWTMDQNGTNPPMTFPANPVSGGINTSATVAQFIAEDAGMDWALVYTNDIDAFTFDANNHMVKIMVYKTVISNVGIKFEDGAGGLHEILIPNTVTNQWEELTYDFSAVIGSTYNRIVIIPDFAPRAQDNTIYIDNVQIPEGVTVNPGPPYDVIDFETGATGATFAWTMDQNGTNPPMTFPANPVSGGINTSATVAQFIAEDAGQDWALVHTNDIDAFTFDANNHMVKIMVYKTVISNVGMKFEDGAGGLHEILIPNTVTNQWEELTYDFSAVIGSSYNRLVIIPDFAPRTQDNTIYIDNIQVPNSGGGVVNPVDSVDVTFSVNAANVVTDAAGLFLGGGAIFGDFNGNQMSDSNNDDVWEVTLRLPKGLASDYTFINGGGTWDNKENIQGQSCAVPPWSDRNFPGAWSDTTILACFGDCSTHDGTCGSPATPINVTFKVDMNNETVDSAGVFLAGPFNSWTAANGPMTDADGDGVWEFTLSFDSGSSIQYKFLNGTGGWEAFDSTHSACTQDFGGFINRVATLGDADTTLGTFTFNACDLSTLSTKPVFTKDELFEINPTLVTNEAIINFKEDVVFADKHIQVVNTVGQVIMNETVGQVQQYRLDASNLSNGLYFIVISSEGQAQTARILVNK